MYAEERIAIEPRQGVTVLPRGGAAQRYRRLRYLFAATDVLSFQLALSLAWLIRHGAVRRLPLTSLKLAGFVFVVQLLVFASFRLYSLTQLSPAEEFRRLITAVTVTVGVLIVVAFWSGEGRSRLLVGLTWVIGLASVMISRRIWHVFLGRARAKGTLVYRTLVVGANAEAESLVDLMNRRGQLGYRVVGCITTNGTVAAERSRVTVLGSVDDLQDVIRRSSADCIFVASSAVVPSEMEKITRAIRLEGVEVRISANISNILSTRLSVQEMAGVMALSLQPVRLTRFQTFAKRTLDTVLSVVAMLVSLPVWLLVALAIKLESRGPVLYKQERVGKSGHRFVMLKFRTMVRDADSRLEEIGAINEATGPLFKVRRDPRITRVGKHLRKWSLDELPQLVNVLRGDMSLVGPRPPLPREVELYEDWHMDRLSVRPGITGLWQVKGRSEIPFDEYVRMDLFYIENWSVAYDLFILAKTIPAVLSRKGAY
jgi:exopolysaccharide biosynthesis polyprenyl glycosylphosphotransferase